MTSKRCAICLLVWFFLLSFCGVMTYWWIKTAIKVLSHDH